jgi:hypothetical protein
MILINKTTAVPGESSDLLQTAAIFEKQRYLKAAYSKLT